MAKNREKKKEKERRRPRLATASLPNGEFQAHTGAAGNTKKSIGDKENENNYYI